MTAAGLFCLAREGISFSSLKAAVEDEEAPGEEPGKTTTEEER